MKTIMMYLNRFFESKTWKIIYLLILAINIVATFDKGFSWFNCVASILMIGTILINPKEFFKPFKVWFAVNKIVLQIKLSSLSKEDKNKAINGIKRISKERRSFESNSCRLSGLFVFSRTEEGWDFWNKVNQAISKQK